MAEAALVAKARELFELFKEKSLTLATAESCTGGLVSTMITEIPGSSSVLDRGFVTYSNEAKADMLNVDMKLIEAHGAVSEPVAKAMAQGAIDRSEAMMSVAITGIAGPGGSEHKPQGLVYIAVAAIELPEITVKEYHFKGERPQVREQAAMAAMDMLIRAVG